MKRISVTTLPFLLLLTFIITTHAIRLTPESVVWSHGKQLHEGGKLAGGVILCQDGHCSGVRRSTAVSNRRSASERTKGEQVQEVKPAQGHHESNKFDKKREDLYVKSANPEASSKHPDVFDLAGMDYSPAKRKPPIHN